MAIIINDGSTIESSFDLRYWLLVDIWSLDEACFILCGVNPLFVKTENKKTISLMTFKHDFYHHEGEGDDGLDGFWDRFNNIKLTKRLLEGKDCANLSPEGWIARAKYKLIDTSDVDKAIAYFGLFNEDSQQSVIVEKPLNPRTENNYLRLIMQLAFSYIKDFDPKKPYEAAALIIENINTTLSKETIASYIQKAHALDSKERE